MIVDSGERSAVFTHRVIGVIGLAPALVLLTASFRGVSRVARLLPLLREINAGRVLLRQAGATIG